MALADAELGIHAMRIELLKTPSRFQIYRDKDLDQGFYPCVQYGNSNHEIVGPALFGNRRSWEISGQVGDRFNIEFHRHPKYSDQLSIAWELTNDDAGSFLLRRTIPGPRSSRPFVDTTSEES